MICDEMLLNKKKFYFFILFAKTLANMYVISMQPKSLYHQSLDKLRK